MDDIYTAPDKIYGVSFTVEVTVKVAAKDEKLAEDFILNNVNDGMLSTMVGKCIRTGDYDFKLLTPTKEIKLVNEEE